MSAKKLGVAILGTGNIGTEFIGSSRLSLYYNVGNTQLLANFTPATLT